MCVGDWIQKFIEVISLGLGKKIATYIANLFGFEDCGCNKRQERINEFFGCNKEIEL